MTQRGQLTDSQRPAREGFITGVFDPTRLVHSGLIYPSGSFCRTTSPAVDCMGRPAPRANRAAVRRRPIYNVCRTPGPTPTVGWLHLERADLVRRTRARTACHLRAYTSGGAPSGTRAIDASTACTMTCVNFPLRAARAWLPLGPPTIRRLDERITVFRRSWSCCAAGRTRAPHSRSRPAVTTAGRATPRRMCIWRAPTGGPPGTVRSAHRPATGRPCRISRDRCKGYGPDDGGRSCPAGNPSIPTASE